MYSKTLHILNRLYHAAAKPVNTQLSIASNDPSSPAMVSCSGVFRESKICPLFYIHEQHSKCHEISGDIVSGFEWRHSVNIGGLRVRSKFEFSAVPADGHILFYTHTIEVSLPIWL